MYIALIIKHIALLCVKKKLFSFKKTAIENQAFSIFPGNSRETPGKLPETAGQSALIRVSAVVVAGDIVTAHEVADVRTLVLFRPPVRTSPSAEKHAIDIAGHRYGLDLGTYHAPPSFLSNMIHAGSFGLGSSNSRQAL